MADYLHKVADLTTFHSQSCIASFCDEEFGITAEVRVVIEYKYLRKKQLWGPIFVYEMLRPMLCF